MTVSYLMTVLLPVSASVMLLAILPCSFTKQCRSHSVYLSLNLRLHWCITFQRIHAIMESENEPVLMRTPLIDEWIPADAVTQDSLLNTFSQCNYFVAIHRIATRWCHGTPNSGHYLDVMTTSMLWLPVMSSITIFPFL